MEIHDNDNGKYACDWDIKPNHNKMTLVQERITCVNCLKLIIKEWERQVKSFSGQPLRNAKEGLRLSKIILRKRTK